MDVRDLTASIVDISQNGINEERRNALIVNTLAVLPIAGGVKYVKKFPAVEEVIGAVAKHGDEVVSSSINIDDIRPQLMTEPDTAFFWSGRTDGVSGAEIAANIAKKKGGVTLESTLEANNISMPEWDFNNPESIDAWNLASSMYAEQVSGEVHAVIGSNLRSGNIWENVELPRLKNNPKVTKIITIDPKTGVETIIFER